ncbi:MAG: sensor histidine kinase [Bacteroidetes bacterium]|nr:MAG: sensor histidine kinase [Bacteroidota bacterium]MBL1145748.1 sensor histidine kinase [Bacteroidota bacterium]
MNWDSLFRLNQVAIALVDNDIDSAKQINEQLFKYLSHDSPDSLSISLWQAKRSISFYKGNYEDAIQSNLEYLKIAKKNGDTSKMIDALIVYGTINYYTNAYESAIKQIKESIQLTLASSVPNRFASSPYNTLGAIYNSMNKRDSAIYYYKKSVEFIEGDSSDESQYMRALIYANLGALYILNEELDLAIKYLELGISFNKISNRNSGLAFCSNKLGELYLRKGEFDKAYEHIKMADSLAKFSATFELQKDNKYTLLKYYLHKENNQVALKHLSEFNLLIDSVIADKTSKNIQEFQTKYEVEKKEAELELVNEKATNLSLANKTKDLYIAIIMVVSAIIAISLLAIYYSVKNKRKLVQMDLKVKENQLDEMMAIQESNTYSAMLKGQEKERERIAQDLHDRLGGTLAALKLSLRRPENSVGKEDLAIVDEAVNEVRSIAHNLSSGLLQKYGLNEALLQLKQTIERTSGIQLKVYLHQDIALLDQTAILGLYRIVQELVSNTLKHANASEISVQTNSDGNTFNLIYEDNGKGFNPKEVKQGIGLENIKARVKKMNGSLHVDAEKGRGSIFIIELNQKS